MHITILAVGKIHQKWLATGIEDYSRRLKKFGRLDIIELPEAKLASNPSPKEIEQALEKQAEHILTRLPKGIWVAALDSGGTALGSEGMAQLLEKKALAGESHLGFIIGGSHGLAPKVCRACPMSISFGANTFPHQLFRLMLLEQLYRAEKIRSGQRYHK